MERTIWCNCFREMRHFLTYWQCCITVRCVTWATSGINPLCFLVSIACCVCVGNVSLPGWEPTTHSVWKVHSCDLFLFIRLWGNFLTMRKCWCCQEMCSLNLPACAFLKQSACLDLRLAYMHDMSWSSLKTNHRKIIQLGSVQPCWMFNLFVL